ncbi:CLUMA_CG011640, isoform A [Clunio marinus]|uniref:CLUMA_CG011640, isoform A n=1 Tax=Clunio marinus TaxID=568069 RepID=A0A1J1IGW1_9DIPT|nr:CLUMA_CG011640, isoform A [Clunio marinus]
MAGISGYSNDRILDNFLSFSFKKPRKNLCQAAQLIIMLFTGTLPIRNTENLCFKNDKNFSFHDVEKLIYMISKPAGAFALFENCFGLRKSEIYFEFLFFFMQKYEIY